MANFIYLTRFSYDFQNEKPIPIAEWQDCAKHFGFEFKQNDDDIAIGFYCEELEKTVPLFWVDENIGEGSMKEGDALNFGMEERFLIAQYLQALIVQQEGDIIFICNCGNLFDFDNDYEPIKLSLDDLVQHEILLKDDMKQSIMDLNFIIKQQRQNKYANSIVSAKPWWRFW